MLGSLIGLWSETPSGCDDGLSVGKSYKLGGGGPGKGPGPFGILPDPLYGGK